MRLRLAFALAFSAALGGIPCVAPANAQPTAVPVDHSVLNRLDSLRRVIQRRILSDQEKKDIRACDREKTKFLKDCRSDSAYARVDRDLNDAKLHGADMNDPSVQALMEKKFAAEKACDDRYAAQPRAKQCLAGEEKRRKALEKALKADKEYQSLLKKSQPKSPPLGTEQL